jgi:hypothetical protein
MSRKFDFDEITGTSLDIHAGLASGKVARDDRLDDRKICSRFKPRYRRKMHSERCCVVLGVCTSEPPWRSRKIAEDVPIPLFHDQLSEENIGPGDCN